MKNGDHIKKINGRNVSEITFEEQRHLLDKLDSVTLTIERGSETEEIAFHFDEPKI